MKKFQEEVILHSIYMSIKILYNETTVTLYQFVLVHIKRILKPASLVDKVIISETSSVLNK